MVFAESMLAVDVVSRFLHILTAVVLVGGTAFMRFVLLPSAQSTLTEEQHAALKTGVVSRWKKFVHGGIGLLLLTGFYNFLVVAIPKHKGDSTYHMLMGIKILMALAIFFLASALIGRSKTFDKMRSQPAKWLTILFLLAATLIGLSSYIKVALPGKAPAVTANS